MILAGIGHSGGMLNLAIPVWELVLRSVVVYGFLLALASHGQAPDWAARPVRSRSASRPLQRRAECHEWRGQLAGRRLGLCGDTRGAQLRHWPRDLQE